MDVERGNLVDRESSSARLLWCGLFAIVAAIPLVVWDRSSRGSVATEEMVDEARPHPAESRDVRDRLYERFHVRSQTEIAAGKGDRPFDADELDPLLWTQLPEREGYLLGGPGHREAVAVLQELLDSEDAILSGNRVDRALLQRDLWALFDWVANPEWSRGEREAYASERRDLYVRLAEAIGRLALADEAIAELPDTYAATVATGRYPGHFDPEKPELPFLPPHLWDADGPWVSFGEWSVNPVVTRHVAFFEGRSVFAVFLHLPTGREATTAYLQTLRAWQSKVGKGDPPQLPPGTQVALARRLLLVDASGEIVPTRVTEMVQIRILHDPTSTADGAQTFLEFRLRRSDLLSGRTAALTVVGADERERADALFLAPAPKEERTPIMGTCRSCHLENARPGILSVHSYTGGFDTSRRGARSLVESEVKLQEDSTIAWKRRQFSWGLLTGLREAE